MDVLYGVAGMFYILIQNQQIAYQTGKILDRFNIKISEV